MKKQLKLLLLVALLASYCIPALSQSSTQGKEFWVSLIPSKSPNGENPSDHGFGSYIAISAPKACSVRVSNPNASPVWSQTYTIQNDNSWLEIKDIPLDKWYSESMPASEQVLDKGIKVEATEEVSVYTCLRWNYSMDATNILPVTALQSEYIVQTYGPSNKDGIKRNVFSVLAAEDCIVDITLTAQTEGGRTNTISNLSLKAGQVYHVRSAENESLNGSRVVARNGKKIAVFAGCPLGNIPNVFADRDLVYEQLFPVDYWGQNFVVVRSKEKDANRVIITAQNDNTDVTIYGHYDPSNDKANAPHTPLQDYSLTLQAGESYEFEMSIGYTADPRGGQPDKRWDDKRKESLNGVTFIDSAVYISASCPCAVLSYDVGNSYLRDEKDQLNETTFLTESYHTTKDSGKKYDKIFGAPAMTWVAPIEQMMNDVVFGVMGTDKTDRHFVNIIVPQAGVNTATMNGRSISSYFHPVESNPSYYYARITLPKTVSGTQNPFYRLHCEEGFTATVYGNGDDESYAYTVGSSTIKRGVTIDNYTFTDGISDHRLCVGDEFNFTPKVEGTYSVSRVIWNFGDGIVEETTSSDDNEDLSKLTISHPYLVPGWYDVSASIYGSKVCPKGSYEKIGDVNFSFYVGRPDTIRHTTSGCVAEDYQGEMTRYDTTTYDCDSVVIDQVFLHRKSSYEYTQTANERAVVNGVEYTSSQDITWVEKNAENCDSTITCHLQIVKCLDMQIENKPEEQETCAGKTVDIPFSYCSDAAHGQAFMYIVKSGTRPSVATNAALQGDGYYLDNETAVTLDITGKADGRKNGVITLPIRDWKPGRYITCIRVEDLNCLDDQGNKAWEQSTALNVTVKYPENIMVFKFNNVLAVYQKGFGGNKGYDFTAYQWYRNGEKIDALLNPSAATSIYHTEEIFTPGDEYYVELTDKDNITLPSCGFTVPAQEDLDDYTKSDPREAPAATKKLINNRMCIEFRGQIYDAYGQRVK